MINLKSNKTKAVIGTILFHVGLLIIFLVLGFTPPYPIPEEEGVEINLGYSDDGMGDVQPEVPTVQETSPTTSENTESFNDENIVTQDIEEAPAIISKPNEEKTITEETTEVTEKNVPEEPKQEVNPNAIYNPTKQTATTGGDQGITGKPGDQGNPFGTPNSDNYGDKTGWGDKNISFNLRGRRIKQLVKPHVTLNKSGKVIVDIWVDKFGNVARAIPGAKGSNTTDPTLFKLAEEAAFKCKFDSNPKALEEQKGTITFNFILQK